MKSTKSAGLRLLREGGLYTFGQLLLRGGNFLLIPLYLDLLDPADYGAFGVVKNLVNLLVPLAIFGQTHSLLRLGVDVERDEDKRHKLLSTVVTWVLATSGILIAGAALAWPLLHDWIDGVPLWPLGAAGLAIVAGQALFNVVLAWLQSDGRAEVHTLLNGGRWFVLAAGIFLFMFVLDLRAEGILLAMAVSFAVAGAVGLWLVMDGRGLGADRSTLRATLAYGLPFLPHTIGMILFTVTDQILLAAHESEGLASAGVYLLATQLASAVYVLAMGLQKAWVPFFLREDRDREGQGWERVRLLSFFVVSMVAIAAVGVSLLAPELVLLAGLFSDNDWSAAAQVVPILVLGIFVRSYYLVAIAVVMANKRIARWIAVLTLSAAFMNIVLNLLWIPRWGTYGAAWATTVSWGAVTLGTALLSRLARKVPFKLVHALVLLGLVPAALWLGVGRSLPMRAAVMVGFLVVLAMLDGKDLRAALRTLRSR